VVRATFFKQLIAVVVVCFQFTVIAAALQVARPEAKSFLAKHSQLKPRYQKALTVLNEHQATSQLAHDIFNATGWIGKKDGKRPKTFSKDMDMFIAQVRAAKGLSEKKKKEVVLLLTDIKNKTKPRLVRDLAIAGGVIGGSTLLWTLFCIWTISKARKNARAERLQVALRRNKDSTPGATAFYVPDDDTRISPQVRVATALVNKGVPMTITVPQSRSASGHHSLIHVKLLPADTVHQRMSSAQKLARKYKDRKTQALKPFLSTPAEKSQNKFEKAAWVVSQIPSLSVEAFKQDAAKAKPLLDERMRSVLLNRANVLASDRPEELMDASAALQKRLIAELSQYGKAVPLKDATAWWTRQKMDFDGTFVIKFVPRGFDAKTGGVVLKITNPYAFYKMQEKYKNHGLSGENHSVRRNVERVLAAEKIRSLAAGSAHVAAPEKHLALRQGADGTKIDDRTAVVIADALSLSGKPIASKDITDTDIDAILRVLWRCRMIDGHMENIVKGQDGKIYLIDLEKMQVEQNEHLPPDRTDAAKYFSIFQSSFPAFANRIAARIDVGAWSEEIS